MKIFTVDEANALLPTVKGIVTNIQKLYKRLTTYRSEAQAAAGAADNGGGGIHDGARYAQLVTSFTNDLGELDKLGVQMKDFGRGLIDFPSLRDGRVVLLCWQLGEGDSLEWWHDVEDGFAGRTPI